MIHIFILGACGIAATGINAHNIIRKSDLELSYHGWKNNTCDVEEYRFQAIMNSKLSVCVIECAMRERCAVMNYRPDYKLCELHQINAVTSNLTGNCFQMVKEDIYMIQSPCVGTPCPNGTSCDTNLGICKIKECLEVPRLNNGRVRGNLRAVGNRIKYECNQGYHLADSLHDVAECLENGTWSTEGDCLTNYIASAVGKLCNTTNCLDSSVRCVEQSDGGPEYCHCQIGFEYDYILKICVEVCRNYSTDASEFIVQPGFAMSQYNLHGSDSIPVASVAECVSYCTTNYPDYLSIELVDIRSGTICGCSPISEQQHFLAHGALLAYSTGYFADRPCAITM